MADATDDDVSAIQAIYAQHVLTGVASFEETPPIVEDMRGRPALRAATLRHKGGRILGRWIVDHREFGGAEAFDLVAQPRRFLEIEICCRGAHARFKVCNCRLEIVADGSGLGELAFGAGAGRDQHVVALVDAVEDVGDALAHALRRDAVLGVERFLLLAAPRRLGHGALHRAGDGVGIEDDPAVDIARGAADGLHQRGFAAQKSLLVGIENGNQRAFRNIEALAQQIDADQRIEGAQPQIADDLDALDGIDV